MERYVEDYHLQKTNDLLQLGFLLQFQVESYRAQREMNPKPKVGKDGLPTSDMEMPDDRAVSAAMGRLMKASGEIQKIEKLLGIDKASREAGGQHTVANFIQTLKKAAHERGIRISERVLEMEAFFNDLSWRLRVLEQADAEDRAYHDLTPETICKWAREKILDIQAKDQEWAREVGKLYVGKL